MAGEGAKLREARLKKGWSLHDAEEATKIRIRYLEALEEENYDILPGPVYVKGFLRNYSKHLEINSDEIIALYQESAGPKVEPTPLETKSVALNRPRRVKPVIIAIIGVVILGTAFYMLGTNGSEPNPPASGYSPPPVPNPPETLPPVEENPLPGDSQPTDSLPQDNPLYEGVYVELTFDENCWLSYRVDDGPVTQKTYVAGTSLILEAKETVTFLSIGNAGGLNITANGQTIPKLGNSGDVVRNYTLSRESIAQTGNVSP